MCLIVIAAQAHPNYPLVVAANRDEFFSRSTKVAGPWDETPKILAGRDLTAGGTWMGITLQGRFAALTNFREPGNTRPESPSRGKLVSDFLSGGASAMDYMNSLSEKMTTFNGFNLLCGTLTGGLWHLSNRAENTSPVKLGAGIYGLSNHLLDTLWPKVVRSKSELANALAALPSHRAIFDLLRDDSLHDDDQLPRTGISLEWERTLSASFVRTPNYGTRSSTVLSLDKHGVVRFDEQTWLPAAHPGNCERFCFRLPSIESS